MFRLRSNKMNQMNVKFAIYLSATTFFAVAFIAVLFYMSASSIVLNDASKQTSDAVVQSGIYIEGYLDKLKSLSDLIAMHPDTIATLVSESGASKKAVQALLDVADDSDERILSIALIAKDGRMMAAGADMLIETSSDMMEKSWYMEAKNSHQMPQLTSLRHTDFTMDKNTWVVSVSREIIDDAGEHLGVLLIDIDYNFIEDYLENLSLGESGYAFIINSNDGVVYHPDVEYFDDDSKLQSLLEIYNAESGYESQMGLLTFKTSIGHSNWNMVGLSSLDNVKFLRRQLVESVILVSTIVIIAGIVGGLIVAKRMTTPIKKLELAMRTVDEDWNNVNIPSESSTEIIELTEQYNVMINKIKILMNEIATNEKQMKKFEIQALQSQINPHFLYNTLDTIVWLAELDETDKVVNVTKSLAHMLRLSLKKDEGHITLKEELEHVRNYLTIQEERYSDELEYHINASFDTALYYVPKLILQPIVENAIYHGIRTDGKIGCIDINVEIKDKHLIITVIDNGKGFDTSDVIKSSKVKLGGVGITNVDQRLKLIFGKQYGLKINSEIGKGTTVTYVLPIQ